MFDKLGDQALSLQETTALTVSGLHKSFGNVEVLKGVSFTARKGDVIAVLGSSGSGKSTMLRCVNLLETPDSGLITVSGEAIQMKKNRRGESLPVDRKQVERIRSKLTMVFQQFNLWSHMTILENVIEAPVHVLKVPKAEAIEKAKHYLNKVGIFDKIDAYPAHMSGGQQQRAAIARLLPWNLKSCSLMNRPRLLIPSLWVKCFRLCASLPMKGGLWLSLPTKWDLPERSQRK